MKYGIRTLDDVAVSGETVLYRVDINQPADHELTGGLVDNILLAARREKIGCGDNIAAAAKYGKTGQSGYISTGGAPRPLIWLKRIRPCRPDAFCLCLKCTQYFSSYGHEKK